jgi:putative flippase GtrA
VNAAETDIGANGVALWQPTTGGRDSGRWVRFNLVGVLGFAVQMLVLSLLTSWAGVPANVAVALAVLAAVSHNFAWHERVTWPGLPRRTRIVRWLSFHASTGVVSIGGNLVLTALVMRATQWPPVPANVVAVVLLSVANYWVSDRLVFRRGVGQVGQVGQVGGNQRASVP